MRGEFTVTARSRANDAPAIVLRDGDENIHTFIKNRGRWNIAPGSRPRAALVGIVREYGDSLEIGSKVTIAAELPDRRRSEVWRVHP